MQYGPSVHTCSTVLLSFAFPSLQVKQILWVWRQRGFLGPYSRFGADLDPAALRSELTRGVSIFWVSSGNSGVAALRSVLVRGG